MKIYNEIVIDMNPESSSYGETLHEDSFDYDGPMMLAADPTATQIGDAIRNTGHGGVPWSYTRGQGYWSVGTGDGAYWLIKVKTTGGSSGMTSYDAEAQNDGYWILMTEDFKYVDDSHDTVKRYLESGGPEGIRAGIGNPNDGGVLDDWWKDAIGETPEGVKWPTDWGLDEEGEPIDPRIGTEMDPAGKIRYEDFVGFLDQETGKIKDVEGFKDYIKTLPGAEDLGGHEIKSLMEYMPDLTISPQDLSKAQRESGEDIYGLEQDISGVHTKLGEERGKQASAAGISGIMGPSTGGLGGTDTSFTEGLYGQVAQSAGDIRSARTDDYYGLAEEKEEDFYGWFSELLQD